MKKPLLLQYLKRRFVSKWIVLLLDLMIIAFSLLIVFTLLGNKELHQISLIEYYKCAISVLTFALIGHIVFKPHFGVIRYTTMHDIKRIIFARSTSFACSILYFLFVANRIEFSSYRVPLKISASNYVFSVFLLILFRLSIKYIFNLGRSIDRKPRIIIYGAGEAAEITMNVLSSTYEIVAIIDDNISKKGKRFNGIKIIHSGDFIKKFAKKIKVQQIVISVQNCTPTEKRNIYNRCIEWELEVKTVPPIEQWIDGELTRAQIKSIHIDDLLGRDAIQLQNGTLKSRMQGKTILVTGAAGSIGSELVRQLLFHEPSTLILIDQAETQMYHLEQELRTWIAKSNIKIVPLIADVKDKNILESIFTKYPIHIIFHAAAYKHVPAMEQNPLQAIKVNILGTRNLADLANQFHIEKMILVSTDKAVNPTNIMGATKRAAEMYVQSKNSISKTSFITTRFGNVLDSNGSVIPLFKKQIASGGPLTVTHPEITRYFMTIPEACQLVLEAAFIGKGGEIFVFDMGESVKIADLARKMIHLSGFVPDVDIKIEFTGLRPGEKLYEELLNDSESVLPTHHEKIMISKLVEHDFADVLNFIKRLEHLAEQELNELEAVKCLKEMIPEYLSKNSRFEHLDMAKLN